MGENTNVSMENFLESLLSTMDKAEAAVKKNFEEFMAENGDSHYTVSDHDPTWTGFTDRLRLGIIFHKTDDGFNNYIEFRPESKHETWEEITFSELDYKKFLTKENYQKEVVPALTKWFQERIDKDEYGGFYSAYPMIPIMISGYKLEDEIRWDMLEDIKPVKSKRLKVREYIKKCLISKDYEEWKSVGENPAHLEVFWLYDQVDIEDIEWYFTRIANFEGDVPYFSLFYDSWEWQIPEFVKEVCSDDNMTPEKCKKFYDILNFIEALGGMEDEIYDYAIDFLKKNGFDPDAQENEKDINDSKPLSQSIIDKISKKLPPYLIEFKNARKNTFIEENDDKELPKLWREEGYVINYARVTIRDDDFRFYASAFDWEYDTPSSGKEIDFIAPLSVKDGADKISKEEKAEILSALTDFLNEKLKDNKDECFAPVVRVEVFAGEDPADKSKWEPVKDFDYAKNEDADIWIKFIQDLHDGMLEGEKKPYSNFERVLDAIWWHIYNQDFQPMLKFMKDYYEKMDGIHFGSSMRENLSWILKYDCRKIETKKQLEKKKKGKNILTTNERDLFEFSVQATLECDDDKLAIKAAHDRKKIYENATIVDPVDDSDVNLVGENSDDSKAGASESDGAAESVDESDIPEDIDDADDDERDTWYRDYLDDDDAEEDIFRTYSDKNISATAGYNEDGREDYFPDGWGCRGWIAIKILNENEEAYKEAIKFMKDVIKDGFPARCELLFSSDVKNYIPLKNPLNGKPIYEDDGSQFWGNASKYPALLDDIRDYVKVSTENVLYISGDEMEEDDSTFYRPDFFAMAAVVMLDDTGADVADSYVKYGESIDITYAQGIFEVIRSYLDTYGLNEKNAENLVSASEYGVDDVFGDYLRTLKSDGKNDERIEVLKLLIKYNQDTDMGPEYYEEILEEILEDAE